MPRKELLEYRRREDLASSDRRVRAGRKIPSALIFCERRVCGWAGSLSPWLSFPGRFFFAALARGRRFGVARFRGDGLDTAFTFAATVPSVEPIVRATVVRMSSSFPAGASFI